MRLSVNNLLKRADYLKKIIAEKEKAIRNVPDGRIRISTSHGITQFFYSCPKWNIKRKYMTAKDQEMVRMVAQREYDEAILKSAKAELDSLEKIIARYNRGSVDDIYDKMPEVRRKLVTPILITDEEYVENWLKKPYKGLGFKEGDPELYNKRNIRMRSKSEIIISDRYDLNGVPYKYEKPLHLKGYKTVYPDFTILNVRYRKEIIHEHLGKMDDPEYLEDNIEKIKAYIKNGYTLGKDFILTGETQKHPLNIYEIDNLIENVLT